ncbi:hypothetical protein Psch_02905 [Pelotomaculum schinkii]|uniref:Uncharacterized protein n=1 Tax=Pelotomaculum schinkii TaxID=78350 RepID=A0A4Y7RAY0_9FIRM|nr:hypothetical protein Psch_02905 [Pelotomaculum schinkii]
MNNSFGGGHRKDLLWRAGLPVFIFINYHPPRYAYHKLQYAY